MNLLRQRTKKGYPARETVLVPRSDGSVLLPVPYTPGDSWLATPQPGGAWMLSPISR